jgi:hypothetical protein
MAIRTGFLGMLLLAVVLISGTAAGQGQVIIEEETHRDPSVGGRAHVGNDGVSMDIRVQPESNSYSRRTITLKGPVSIRVEHYRQPCDAPCSTEYCYPPNHVCGHCNDWRPQPCPR